MKNDVVNNIRLDVNRQKNKAAIYVRAGDTKTRTVHFTIADNGSVVGLDNLIIALITIEKPDGNYCYNDLVKNGNELQYTLTTQSINVPGECKCELELTFEDGSKVTVPGFSIYVYEKYLSDKYIESTNEYKGVTAQVVLAKEYADSASAAVTECKGYAETTESASTETEENRTEVEEIYNQALELQQICQSMAAECNYLYQQFAETGVAQVVYQNAIAYTDQAIANLINGAPSTLDTLKEIADAMEENADVVSALDAAIGSKADATETTSLINQLDERIDTLEDSSGYPIS